MIIIGITIFVICVILTIIRYRNRLRSLMPILRLLALVLIILIFTRFTIHYTRVEKKTRRPKVLIDVSKSMDLGSRSGVGDSIRNQPDIKPFLFASDLSHNPSPNRTDIGGAIKTLADDPGPIILITDGNNNQGPDPVAVARSYPYPIYPVRLPEEKIKNLAIIDIEGPDYLFVGDTGKFKIQFETRDIKGAIKIATKLDGRTIDQKQIKIKSDGMQESEFKIIARRPGHQILKVTAQTNQPEIELNDNNLRYALDIVKRRYNLLFISNLNPDVGIIRRIITGIDWLQGEFQIFLDGEKQLRFGQSGNRPNMVILDNIARPEKILPGIIDSVRSGLGLIILAGENTKSLVTDLRIKRTPRHDVRPIPEINLAISDIDLPPFSNLIEVVGDYGKLAILLKSEDKKPIAFYEDYGKGRIVYLLAYPFWQFYLRLVGIGEAEIAKSIMRRFIELASPMERKKSLVVHPVHRVLRVGEGIDLSCGYYSPDLKPVSGGQVFFTITKDTITTELVALEKRPGFYTAKWQPASSGDYTIIAQTENKADTGSVSVADVDIESSYQPVNQILLNRLARISGGRVIKPTELSSLLKNREEKKKERRRFPFDQPWIIIALAGILSLEWFLRKREGLS